MAVATAMTAERMPMCSRRRLAGDQLGVGGAGGVRGGVASPRASGAGSSRWAGAGRRRGGARRLLR